MAGNDDYQLTGFLLSPALHTGTPVSGLGGGGVGQVWRWWVLVGGPRPGHLILINYPQ